jgi:hypothetical protein
MAKASHEGKNPSELVSVNLFRLSLNQLAWLREQGTPARQEALTDIAGQIGGLIEQKQAAQPTGGYTGDSKVSDYRKNF